ncbi:hypothetical protein HD554DRAFT_2035998 [Boletus coccyginus]|nr:hypothetical protein HD554DRAFT_2035998 [Boletus coccyginus]
MLVWAPHKGPKTSFSPQESENAEFTTAAPSSLSMEWITAQFGEDADDQVIAYKSKKSINQVQRTLTDQDHMMNSKWAGAILEALGVNEDLSPTSPTKRRRMKNIVVNSTAQTDGNGLNGSRMVAMPVTADNLPDVKFMFDVHCVPDPPAINFSGDIDHLFREWEMLTLLIVNGHSIPVKHWGQFYKKAAGAKETAWDTLKTKWSKWKAKWRKYADDDSFWCQFSTEKGEGLCYQQILNKISSTRVTADTQDAADARLFFSGNLEHPTANGTFHYTRSGKSHLLTKDSSIAKVWQTLLTMQPVIAEQWGVLCTLQHAMEHAPMLHDAT